MYDRSPARELDVQREVAFALLRFSPQVPCARKKPSSLMSQQVCDFSAATEWVTLTMRELGRLKVIQAVVDRMLKPGLAAQRLQLTVRQVERLVARYKQSGAGGVGHTSRGRPGNRKLDEAIACRALTLIRDRYADFGPTLAGEKLRECHGLTLSKETVRHLMTEAGLWIPRTQRPPKIHQPRNRRSCLGELIQIDGSDHR
jgi:transposase